MLCLTRKAEEKIIIIDNRTDEPIMVISVERFYGGNRVRLGFDAEKRWVIRRMEIHEEMTKPSPTQEEAAIEDCGVNHAAE